MLILTSRLMPPFPPSLPPPANRAQHENENALSWQSAGPPLPSLQLLGGSPSGNLTRVIHGAPNSAAPPAVAIGWQIVTLPAASVIEAVISRAAPVPGMVSKLA